MLRLLTDDDDDKTSFNQLPSAQWLHGDVVLSTMSQSAKFSPVWFECVRCRRSL